MEFQFKRFHKLPEKWEAYLKGKKTEVNYTRYKRSVWCVCMVGRSRRMNVGREREREKKVEMSMEWNNRASNVYVTVRSSNTYIYFLF